MSILAAAAGHVSLWALLIAFFAAATSLAVAWLLGILQNDKLDLTPRIPPDRPATPLVGVLFAGLVMWLVLGPWLLGQGGNAEPAEPSPSSGPSVSFTSDRQLVIVNAVVPTAAFVILLVGDAVVRPHVRQRLGFDVRRLPKGLAIGFTGMAIALPLVYCAMVASEWLYQRVGYEHPSAHELLRTIGQTPDALVKNLAIVVAAVVAPLWEELLFRGHIQTLLRDGIVRLRASATLEASDAPRPADSWLAILLTSLMFAGIHQPWTWPAIFALSVCLGFAYERTGNLWTAVTMHAVFNGGMTAYFLWVR
jgi:membrane protease YdiL (CAAX protease family)